MKGDEAMTLIERIVDVAPRDINGVPCCALYAATEQWKKDHPIEALLAEEAQLPLMSDLDIQEAGGEVG